MPRRGPETASRAPAAADPGASSAAVGTGLVLSGATLAWLLFATPAIERLAGPLAWRLSPSTATTCAIVIAGAAVAGSLLVGLVTIGRGLRGSFRSGAEGRILAGLARRLPPGCRTIPSIRLPDGPPVTDVVIGPFGLVVLAAAPTASGARPIGAVWEELDRSGTWRPAAHPAERLARDADRLRHLLARQEHDFVIRVTPVLVSSEAVAGLVPGVAVVRPQDVPGWLAALRPQRSLTPERLARLGEVLGRPG